MLISLQQALRGLTRNPVRTLLTTLGIVIGIATVIVVLSAGEGFNSFINAQVESQGVNSVTVETRVPPSTKQRSGSFDATSGSGANQAIAITSLKNRDVESIRQIPNVVNAYGAVIGQQVVSYKNVSKNTNIFGADASRFEIDSSVIESGRSYTEAENSGAAQVAVLGSGIAEDLFGDSDPLGQNIRVGSYNFVVIGVYAEKGGFSPLGEDQQVFIPLITAQKKLLGIDHLFFILAELANNDIADLTAEDMRAVLRENHGIKEEYKEDFRVSTQAGNLSTFATILSGVTFLLIAVASISLIVGGVGIMNIMYVVVTERISEIGLKKALGAKNNRILQEFLIEAVLLTMAGGLMGIALGALISFGIAQIAQGQGFAWKFTVPISGVLLSVGTASLIGLVFGVFPARKASLMDPIEALGHE